METERKLDVLADIARALNQRGVTWAVGGSLLLYFKGKTCVFRDIDLMVCETDVEKLKQAIDVYKRQPVNSTREPLRSTLARRSPSAAVSALLPVSYTAMALSLIHI